MKPLERPTLLREVRGEIIEQLRVRRPGAADSKIAGRADESRAEVVHPDSIDDDPRRERILRAGDRLSQLEPTAAYQKRFCSRAVEGVQESAGHSLAGSAGIATDKDDRFGGSRCIVEYHSTRRSGRRIGPQCLDFVLQLGQTLAARTIEQALYVFDGHKRGAVFPVESLPQLFPTRVGQGGRLFATGLFVTA